MCGVTRARGSFTGSSRQTLSSGGVPRGAGRRGKSSSPGAACSTVAMALRGSSFPRPPPQGARYKQSSRGSGVGPIRYRSRGLQCTMRVGLGCSGGDLIPRRPGPSYQAVAWDPSHGTPNLGWKCRRHGLGAPSAAGQAGSATPRNQLARPTCDLCPSYSPQILPYPGSPGTASGEPHQVTSISDKFIPPAHHSPSCALAMLRGHAHAPSPRKQSCQTHTPPPEEATTPLSFRSTPSGAAPRRRSPLQPRIFGFLSWSAASALLSIATSPSKEPPVHGNGREEAPFTAGGSRPAPRRPPLPSSLEPSAPEISTWAIRPPAGPQSTRL